MFTRCPTCTTTFRVTPEQLKARLGRVRCGQCQAVFNALDSLVEEAMVGAMIPDPMAPSTPAILEALPESTAVEAPTITTEPLPTEELPLPPETEAPDTSTDNIEEQPAIASDEPAADEPTPATTTESSVAESEEESSEPARAASEPESLAPVMDDTLPVTGQEDAVSQSGSQNDDVTPSLQPHGLVDIAVEPRHIDAANEPLPVPLDKILPDATDTSITPTVEEEAPLDALAPATELADAQAADSTIGDAFPAADIAANTDTLPATIEIAVVPASLQAANDHLLAGVKEVIEPVVLRPIETATGPAPDLTELMHQAVPLLHQRPPRRWPWSIGIGLGIVALAIQIALLYRVELAALKPGLKPALQSLCQPAGCTVPLPHKIDLLSIETSDLHPGTQKGQLQLSATLMNKANFAQEYPLLEVTLTDVADRSLIVKAIPATDYLPKELKADAGFPPRREINVNLTFDIGDVPAVGYRVYLYHP